MTMTTRGSIQSKEARSASPNGPVGAGIVDVESQGAPSEDNSPATQSPATLQGHVAADVSMPADTASASVQAPSTLKAKVVGSYSGSESNGNTSK